MTSRRARVSAALLATMTTMALSACGGSGDEEPEPQASPTTTTASAPEPEPDADGPQEEKSARAPQLYFTEGEQFHRTGRGLSADSSPREVVERLLAGPTARQRRTGVRTAIPEGVELEEIDASGEGTLEVRVSGEFTEGVGDEPSAAARRQELNARVGQLTYTLTELDEVDKVEVVAGGEKVETASRASFAKPKSEPAGADRPRGAKSGSVRAVQERLARLHFLPDKAVDGVDGYRTRQAVMAFQAWNGLARDGVVGPQTTAALANAKRPRPQGSGPKRRIEVYNEKGVALLITHGRTKRAIHVSTGAPGTPTPPGTFEVFRKELQSWSVPFQVWLPYASYFNAGIAFHEYADVPPFPASHGCVRVPAPEAKGVYRFAKMGTTVVVI